MAIERRAVGIADQTDGQVADMLFLHRLDRGRPPLLRRVMVKSTGKVQVTGRAAPHGDLTPGMRPMSRTRRPNLASTEQMRSFWFTCARRRVRHEFMGLSLLFHRGFLRGFIEGQRNWRVLTDGRAALGVAAALSAPQH